MAQTLAKGPLLSDYPPFFGTTFFFFQITSDHFTWDRQQLARSVWRSGNSPCYLVAGWPSLLLEITTCVIIAPVKFSGIRRKSKSTKLCCLVGSGLLYMDHPKDQSLCLVDWTSWGETFSSHSVRWSDGFRWRCRPGDASGLGTDAEWSDGTSRAVGPCRGADGADGWCWWIFIVWISGWGMWRCHWFVGFPVCEWRRFFVEYLQVCLTMDAFERNQLPCPPRA